MKKKKNSTDLVLDDYFEDDSYEYDENLYSVNSDEKYSQEEKSYNDFFKVEEETDGDSYEYGDSNDSSYSDSDNYIGYLSLVATWFIRLGIAIMIVLIAVFIVQGKFKTLFLYILGLVAAFFFGFFFMYFLNKFTENN